MEVLKILPYWHRIVRMFSGNRKFFTFFFLQQDFLAVFKAFSDLSERIQKPGKPVFSSLPGYIEKIDATGFEPAASASRTQRSTKLSHASIAELVSKWYYKRLLWESQASYCVISLIQIPFFTSMPPTVHFTTSVSCTHRYRYRIGIPVNRERMNASGSGKIKV